MDIRAWYVLLPTALLIAPLFSAPLSAQTPVAPPEVRDAPASLFTPAGPVVDFLWPTAVAAPLPQAEAERDRGRGALWGAGIGFLAGGILGGLSVESDGDDEFGGSLAGAAATGPAFLLGGLFGAGVGALLGATVFAPAKDVGDGAGQSAALHVVPTVSGAGVGMRLHVRLLDPMTVR